MKKIQSVIIGASVFGIASLVGGCGNSDVGVQVEKVAGGQSYVSGTPQERIARIEQDPKMPDIEKKRRISAIKERNNLK